MPLDVYIKGDKGFIADISKKGELLVRPSTFSEVTNNTLAVINTAYNYVLPRAKENFVITGFIGSANKNVGTEGAEIIVYETSALDSIVVDRTLLHFHLSKQTTFGLSQLFVLSGQGKYINAKTDDNEIDLTLLGYFVDTDDLEN